MARVTITIDRNDLGQILDGLTVRRDSYARTAEFMDDENHDLEDLIIEEVRDAGEARALAQHYERIIDDITRQIQVQPNGKSEK